MEKKNSLLSNVKILAISKCCAVPSLICFNLLANIKTFYSMCSNILQKCWVPRFVCQCSLRCHAFKKCFPFELLIYLHLWKYYFIVYITVLDHWSRFVHVNYSKCFSSSFITVAASCIYISLLLKPALNNLFNLNLPAFFSMKRLTKHLLKIAT